MVQRLHLVFGGALPAPSMKTLMSAAQAASTLPARPVVGNRPKRRVIEQMNGSPVTHPFLSEERA